MKRRILASLLSLAMLFTLLPAPAWAAEGGEPQTEPAVCTCETKCAEGSPDAGCPVCAEDAAQCAGQEAAPVCTCETKCAEGSPDAGCPVCAEDAAQCAGQEAAPVCTCETKCAEGSPDAGCPVCAEDAAQCAGQEAAPVCTCETKCAEGSPNAGCPVCAEDAAQCAGQEAAPVCTCETKCAEGSPDAGCPVCAEDAAQCAGQEAADPDVQRVQDMIDALPSLAAMDYMGDNERQTAMEQYAEAYAAYEVLNEDQRAQLTGAGDLLSFAKQMAEMQPYNNVPVSYYAWNSDKQELEQATLSENYTLIDQSYIYPTDDGWATGWYVVEGNVTIEGDVITQNGSTVNLILKDGAHLTVEGCISVGSSDPKPDAGLNIYAQSMDDNMGQLTATGSVEDGDNSSHGILVYQAGLTVHGGKVNATGGTASGVEASYGIYVLLRGNLTVYGGTVNAQGGEASGVEASYGLYVFNSVDNTGVNPTLYDGLTVCGGTVNAQGGEASNNSCGIFVRDAQVTVKGGTVNAAGSTASGSGYVYSCGVEVLIGVVSIEGGTVAAKGGTASGSIASLSCGVYSYNENDTPVILGVAVSGGVLEATGVNYGIFGADSTLFPAGGNGVLCAQGNMAIAKLNIDDYSGEALDDTEKSAWSGVIFENDTGAVYGTSVTPTEDFEVPANATLTIGKGQTLTVKEGVTLTNKGTITVEGALTNDGTIRNLGAINIDGTFGGSGKVVSTVKYRDENGFEREVDAIPLGAVLNATSVTTLTGGTSAKEAAWFVVGQDLTTTGRIIINGYVNLILKDYFTLNATQGINVSEGNTFSVYAQSTAENTAGQLIAGQPSSYSDYTNYGAGIGGGTGANANAGVINLYGGVITATGGLQGGAGIGGGNGANASGGTITIKNVPSLTATGGLRGGAGIGGGYGITADGGTIEITNTAGRISGGSGGGAGIGGGFSNSSSSSAGGSADGGEITITDMFRSVVEGGGANGSGSAGIGGGYSYHGTANGGTIVITNMCGTVDGFEFEGGTVSAGGEGGAGIGGGYSANSTANGGDITIQNVTDGPLTVSGASVGNAGGAGIGGGRGSTSADGGKITIENVTGKLTANGAKSSTGGFVYGAGIGGGYANGTSGTANGGDITIDGGTVTAAGAGVTDDDAYGAGIGGGYGGGSANGGKITVKSGTVTANGATGYAVFGAGIGGGYGGSASGGEIAIEGGSVKATGASSSYSGGAAIGAGIGGGSGSSKDADADGGSVTITGGYVEAKGARVDGSYADAYGADIGGGGWFNNANATGGAVSGGTFSTTNGNAVIFASSIDDADDKTGWSGVIFEGVSGAVYGTSIETGVDFTVPAGTDLSIGKGQTLTLGAGTTLTNSGWIFLKSGGQLKYGGSLGTFKGNDPVTLENPGEGSEADPYQIPNLTTLEFYRERINQTVDCKEGYAAAHYQLTANIDLKSSAANPWTPIGTNEIMDPTETATKLNYFSGVFDGNGHTITGLYVSVSSKDDAAYAGLFGIVKGGTVKDLTISGGSVTAAVTGQQGYSAYAGGVAGYVGGSGSVTNCAVKDVSVSATTQNGWVYAGGVAGNVSGSGSVSNCAVSGGAISASTASSSSVTAGGVAGYVGGNGSVSNCAASCGSVTADGAGNKYAGGVVGMRNPNNSPGTVSSCYYDNKKYTGSGIGSGSGDATGKTSEAFASGEVAWLLQSGQSDSVWGQYENMPTPLSSLSTEQQKSAKTACKVEFKNGETTVHTAYTTSGGTVSLPENPEPASGDQYFAGWVNGADNTAFDASTEVKDDLTVLASFADKTAEEAALPTVESQTTDSITINTVAGQKYAISTDENPAEYDWSGAVAEDGTHTFTGLNPGTLYYIYTYKPATDNTMKDSGVESNSAYTAPEIKTKPIPPATVDRSFSMQLEATSADGVSVTWTVTGLPDGLSLSGNTISGTPKEANISGVELTITATVGSDRNTASSTVTLTISVGPAKLTTPTVTLSSATPGQLTANWQPVPNASGYEVKLNDNKVDSTGTSHTFDITTAGTHKVTVSAIGNANYDHSDVGQASLTFHSVTFNADNNSENTVQYVADNGKATEPAEPVKAGYTFTEWQSSGGEFDFDTPITGNITLTAAWTLNEPTVSVSSDPTSGTAPYNDGETVVTLTANASHAAGEAVALTYQWYKVVEGGSPTEIGTGRTLTLTDVAHSGSYYVVVTAAETDGDQSTTKQSGQVAVTISKAKAETPTEDNYAIDYANETVSFDSDKFEASTAQTEGTAIGSGSVVSGYVGGSIFIRTKGDENHDVSDWLEIQLSARPEKPAAPDITAKTNASITVAAVSGLEYSVDAGASWQSEDTFTGLEAAAEYTVIARVKAVANESFASTNSDGATTTTLNADGSGTVQPGESVTVGGTTVKNDGKEVTIDPAGDGPTTTVTLPEGTTNAEVDSDGSVKLPGNSTVQTGEGPVITVGESGGTVDSDGSVTVPAGGSAAIGDGEDKTAITVGDGGDAAVSPEGEVSLPSSSTVQTGEGPVITVGESGGTVDSDGSVTVPAGGSAAIGDGEDKTAITVGDGDAAAVSPEGNVKLPGNSSVQTGDGPVITVGESGGTVDSDGSVTVPAGGSVTVTDKDDNETTIVLPEGSGVTIAPDGSATLPAGSKVTSGGSTVTLPSTGGTLNSDGSLDYRRPNTGGSGAAATYPPVVSDAGGGSAAVSPANPSAGQTVTVTPKPDEGFEVEKVTVTDRNGSEITVTANGDGTYSFTQPSGKVTIEVTYAAADTVANCSRDEDCLLAAFTDVDMNAWYHDGIHYCVENGLMGGTSATTFAPNATTSRAMLATILHRLAGSPDAGEHAEFSDVAGGMWYTEGIRWASSAGVVGGHGDGTFGPDDPITREQFAVMLYRYAVQQGMAAVTTEENLSGFNDADSVSDYAVQAMNWAVGQGVINGYEDASLRPQGSALRSEAAAMLQRFCGLLEEK